MKILIFVVSLIAGLIACHGGQEQIRFDKQSEYERVLVIDKGDRRYLRFGRARSVNQSVISLTDPGAVPSEYIRIAFLGAILTPDPQRALMIGLGGGTYTELLHRHFPGLLIDAVEIDPVVVEAAKTFFGVREDERYRVHVADGAAFLRETDRIYDLVFIDAYSGEGIPRALATRSFFDLLKARTSADAVVVLNLYKQRGRERSLIRIFRNRFPYTACARTPDRLNLVAFGRKSGMPEKAGVIAAARRFSASAGLSFDLGKISKEVDLECSVSDGYHSP